MPKEQSPLFTSPAPSIRVPGRAISQSDWLLALGIALVWRVVVCLACEISVGAGDGVGYITAARSLMEAGVFSEDGPPLYTPTATRGPGYPAFLVLPLALFGGSLAGIVALQCAMSLLTIAVLARCVEAVRPGQARLTLYFLALAPFEAFFCPVVLTEVLVALCTALALGLPWLRPGRASWLLSGIFWGLAALSRDIMLPIGAVCSVCALWLLRGPMAERGVRQRDMSLALVGLALVVAPWTARNYNVLGQFAPVSKGTLTRLLWIGSWERNGSWADGGIVKYPDYAFASPEERARVEEALDTTRTPFAQQEERMAPIVRQRYRAQPLQSVASWFVRWPRIWIGTRSDLIAWKPGVLPSGSKPWLLFKVALFGANASVLALALVGAVHALRKRDAFLLWLGLPVALTGIFYLPIHSSEARYSQPVYPAILCLAALGALTLHARWKMIRRASA